MKAWYFSNTDRKLRYDDEREIALGITHTVDGEPIMCKRGLHASINILNALSYAPGNIIWRVKLSGKIIKGNNKCVATKRTYIAGGIDISDVLKKFARLCALDVVHLWDAPQVVIDYLKTGDESLKKAAWEAAMAASDTAMAATWAASDASYTSEASDAVWAARAAWAARNAVFDPRAACAVSEASDASGACEAAIKKKQSKRLLRMVMAEMKKQSAKSAGRKVGRGV